MKRERNQQKNKDVNRNEKAQSFKKDLYIYFYWIC